MQYFNVYHYIVIAIVFIIFTIFLFISIKNDKMQVVIGMIALNIVVMSCFLVFAMLLVDQYTKIAKITDLTYNRILQNEKIMFSGKITNVGDFIITGCTIEIKLINQPFTRENFNANLFKPKGFFDSLMSNRKPETPSFKTKKFTIANNLQPKENRPFSVYMDYPANFIKPTYHHKLHCY